MRRDIRPGMTRRGLSIIEVIVGIGIIGLVVAILIPVLGAARQTARDRAAVADLRSLAALTLAYSDDFDGFPPAFPSPADDPSATPGDLGLPSSAFYFDIHRLWHHHIARANDGLTIESDIFHPEHPGLGRAEGAPFYTGHNLSCAFAAQPSFWNPETRRLGPSQLRAPRLTDVAFPAAKSLIVSTWPSTAISQTQRRPLPIPASFVDGSAELVAPRDRIAGYERGDGPTHQQYGPRHFSDFPPMLHTLNGVLGHDRR